MEPATTRAFTAARIVALALIGVTALGLAYLHVGTSSSPVSVPKGAYAGQLTLHSCSYETEKGSYAADCGTLVVPENRADPKSRLIALPVKRIRARSPHPGAPIFRLEGGPGGTNMSFKKASRFAADHDVVLVGYRGVDGSVRLDCPEVTSALEHSKDFLGEASFRAYANGFRSCAKRLAGDGVDLSAYGLPQQVDDLDSARKALGYGRIDLLSESAGTRTAMIYAWRYPKRIHRSVMIGVNPPGHFLWDPRVTDEQIHRYSALCAKDPSCSARTDNLAASMRRTAGDIPEHWWFLPIKPGSVRVASFYGLMESTSEAAPLTAPMTLGSWLSAATRAGSGSSRCSGTSLSRSSSSGARWRLPDVRMRSPRSATSRTRDRSRSSAIRARSSSGAAGGSSMPGPRTRARTCTRGFGGRRFRRCSSAARSTSRPRRRSPQRSSSRISRTAARSCCPGTGTRISLLWLPLRLRRRGRFGRKASVTLRSLYPIVLGLGGWFLAVLVVTTWMPGRVALDDEVMAAVSVGAPIGLAIYFAWANRAWSATIKATGLAAALGGALVGGWLGFNATDGLVALLTTIVGAAAGGNLTILGLDIAWDRQRRDRASYRSRRAESSPGASPDPTSRRRLPEPALVASKRQPRRNEMSPPMQRSNLAARMGRWSASHWKTATFGWLALVVVAFAVYNGVGTKTVDPYTAGPGESGGMDRILNDGFKQPAGEKVVIQSRSLRAGDPAFDATVNDVVARVSKMTVVQNLHKGPVSKDGHTALVNFDIRGDKNKAGDKVGAVLDRVDGAQRAHPGFFIGEFGDASAQKAVDEAAAKDLKSAGVFSIPITLIILVVAFGALVAAGIPLLLALTAVFATMGLLAVPSQLLPIAQEVPATVLLIGLAVGVDYSMFYLRREREERAAGRSERAALEAAAATSGRSVLISGLTVMVAMAGLFLTGDATFASFGVACMLVVAVAVLGSLTVLPALLSKLGDRVDRLRVPHIGRRHGAGGEGRVWGAIIDRVLRRPVLSIVVSGGLLLALAAPAFGLRMVQPGPDTYPQSLDMIKAYNHMQQAFPGTPLPANVVVKTQNVNAAAVRNAIRELKRKALATGRVGEPITVETNPDATVANITVPIKGKGTDAAQASLAALRDTVVPQTVGALPDTQAGVTGLTAEWRDSQEELKAKLPLVVGFVLLFAFGLLLVAFRSIVVAIKAILLNLLSVGAAYGVLVLVFQDGFGRGLLGFSDTSGITPVIPMLLFVILFGLSMDYHVFIVSRIREAFQGGADMDEAISVGIKSTAGVVTSAAVVMFGVFSVFGALSLLMFKQFGVGLAAAILIDATLVRGVLLPATMKLLGDRNWYLPGWLQWLPRLEPEEPPTAPEAKPASVSA